MSCSVRFEYKPVYQAEEHFRGIFEWGMLYKETELGETEARKRAHNSEPYPSPTHAGGLFAINRQYFLSLGTYDPGLLVWGGENFELSFKVWQCGGSIVWVGLTLIDKFEVIPISISGPLLQGRSRLQVLHALRVRDSD